MEAILTPLLLVFILIFGPFIALNAYLLVWLCGPAIRRAGRRFAEGWLEVEERRMDKIALFPVAEAQHPKWLDKSPLADAPGPASDRTPTDPDVHQKYTITGKPIR